MTKAEVESAIGALEKWGRSVDNWVVICAAVVAIFLALEVVFSVIHWRNEKRLRPLRAEQSRLHEIELSELKTDLKDAEARIAEANEQAKKAELALAQFRAPRTLSVEAQSRIVKQLKPYAGQEYALWVASGSEPADFMCLLDGVLTAAGWKKHEPYGIIKVGTPCGDAGLVTLSGLHIRVAVDQSPDILQKQQSLIFAFIAEGVAAIPERDPKNIPDASVIHLMVGAKE